MALAGCEPGGASVPGDLGNGYFVYECTAPGDVTCRTREVSSTGYTPGERFPSQIARGADFNLRFEPRSLTPGAVAIGVGSEDYLLPTGGSYRAAHKGFASILAKARSSGRVMDFTHVRITDAVSLRIDVTDGNARFEAGRETTVRSVPVDSRGDELSGALPTTWRVDDPSLVELRPQTSLAGGGASREPPSVVVVPRAVGVTVLRCKAAGVEGALSLVINGAALPSGDGGPGDGSVGDGATGASDGGSDGS